MNTKVNHNARVIHNPTCQEYVVEYKPYWFSFWKHDSTRKYWTASGNVTYQAELREIAKQHAIERAQELVNKSVVFMAKEYYV